MWHVLEQEGVDTLTTLMQKKYKLNVEDWKLNEPGLASRGGTIVYNFPFLGNVIVFFFNLENTLYLK